MTFWKIPVREKQVKRYERSSKGRLRIDGYLGTEQKQRVKDEWGIDYLLMRERWSLRKEP